MNFVIVDVETTGGSPKNSKITELAMYKYDGEKIIDEFISLVNPEQEIPEFIVRLTGITDAMVENAPKFYEIAKKVLEFTEDCIFVAHNVAFDYGMFRHEFKSLGYDFRLPHLCTVRASRYVIPGHASYSLGKLSRALEIEIVGRHRAGGDALATTKLFDLIYHKDPNQLSTFIQQEVNPKSVHPNLNIEIIDELPNKAGIYKFLNEFNQIIYIGKSIHIKKRVEQHLRNNSTAKGLKMIQEIVRVEYELTGSELIAMLLESELIKKHQPLYNRKLRKSSFPFGLFDVEDAKGYLNLTIHSIAKTESVPLLHFTTRKEGTDYMTYIVEKYHLCQKLCGLYPTQSACFHHSIKQCDGACIGEESPETYNERVSELVKQLSFEGKSFYILDKGRNKGERSMVWIENGAYKGYGFAPFHFNGKEPIDWKRYIAPQNENRDINTILNLFLRKDSSLRIVEY
jgi:DNA polymerase-3 subunit epsilon